MPDSWIQTTQKKVRLPSGLAAVFGQFVRSPLLKREQEGYLFRKFNYLKYKATKLREELDPLHAREQPDG